MSSQNPAPSDFTILVVCSGNICRSPLAEQLLRSYLRDAPQPFHILSAGTVADAGVPMTDEAAALARRYGGVPEGHRSRALTEQQIVSADLVLTATRAHRAAVVSLVPRASRYAFTLLQFVSLVAAIDPEERATLVDAASVLTAAAAQRGFPPPHLDPTDDDIDDPFQQPIEVYERVGAQINRAVQVAAWALRAVAR